MNESNLSIFSDYLCVYIRETLEFCGSTFLSSKYLLSVLPISLLLLHAYNPWLLFFFLTTWIWLWNNWQKQGEKKEGRKLAEYAKPHGLIEYVLVS